MHVEILELAEGEIQTYRRWYWAEGEFVGTRFDVAPDKAVEAARSNPGIYPRHTAVHESHDVRFVTLGKFPLSVVNQVRESSLLILALAHHSRRPGYWKSRLSVPS